MPISGSARFVTVSEIAPRSGVAFHLHEGQTLRIIDPEGIQVSDLLAYNAEDVREAISNGRTFDYEQTILLTMGNTLWSNRSRPMLSIVEDTVGKHDFLLTPCSADTFRLIYGHEQPHRGCHGNLAEVLLPYGIQPDDIPVCFNVFMNVSVDGETGKIGVHPPKSKAGDHILLRAEMDLIIGLTACSAEMSNNYSFKPIGYSII